MRQKEEFAHWRMNRAKDSSRLIQELHFKIEARASDQKLRNFLNFKVILSCL